MKWKNEKSPTFMPIADPKTGNQLLAGDTSPILFNSSSRHREEDPRLCSSISISADSMFDESVYSSARSHLEDPKQYKTRFEILKALKIHLVKSERADRQIAEDQL